MKSVKCKSGIRGWQAKLHEVYDSLEEFRSYAEIRNIHGRLGFKTIAGCWRSNPLVMGSVIPEDLMRVKTPKPEFNSKLALKKLRRVYPTLDLPKYDGWRNIFDPSNPHSH